VTTTSDAAALPFSRDEYGRRLDAVRAVMRQRGLDAVLVDQAEHLAYLTAFDRSASNYQVCVIPLRDEPIMVLRRLDEPSFFERTWLRRHVPYADWEDPFQIVGETLRRHGWDSGRIGMELDSHYLTVRRYEALKAALPRATLVDFSGVLWELRLKKSPAEIDYLRAAARIADAAMRSAIEAASLGACEREPAAVASRLFVELGADHGRAGIITSGKRSGSLHGVLGNRRLEAGDILHMELIPQVQGYSARLMRPTIIGTPTAEQAGTARRLIAIQDEQIAAMKPGAVAKDVDRICREQVMAAGLRDRYDNATGYTLGYYSAWGPRSSDFTRVFLPTSEWTLEPGMVFHMYTTAGGMTFSDTVLVGEGEPLRLTQTDRRLFVR
jgi:Xaa-Pro aminopeptidase